MANETAGNVVKASLNNYRVSAQKARLVADQIRGKQVFYPMGWDDNGLPTERRVQNYYGVRCDPSLHYEESFEPPEKPGKELVPVSRRNFIELCLALTEIDEQALPSASHSERS